MAAEVDIDINLKGGETIGNTINNIQTLKERLKEAKSIFESADIGSEAFKKASKDIEELDEQLKELTKSQKKNEEQIEKTENAFTKLTKELKKAKGELAGLDVGTKEFEEASKKVQKLQDDIGDLADATKIQGNGVERLGASFGLLKESLGSGDLDKAKLAFNGLGAAMSALPIFLIIEGLKLLIENFEAIYKFFQSFTDSAQNVARLEKEVKALEVSTAKQKVTLEGLVSIQEAQLELMKEQGKGSKEIAAQEEKIFQTKLDLIKVEATQIKTSAQLHLAKLQEIQDNDSLYEGMQRIAAQVQRALGNDIAADAIQKTIDANKKERSEESQKAFEDAMNRVKQLTDEVAVLTINREKDKTAAANENTENYKKAQEDKTKKAEEEGEKIYKAWKAEQERMAAEEAIIIPEQAKAVAQTEIEIEAAKNAELLNLSLLKYEEDKKRREKEKQEKIKAAQEDLAIAEQGFDAAQNLSDTLFFIKSANTKKGSKEEEKAARLQFKINKGLSISSTIIKGAEAVIAALTTPGPIGIARSIATGLATAASVAKIAGTQFESTSAGGAEVPTGGGNGGGQAAPETATFTPPRLEQIGGGVAAPGTPGSTPVVKAFVVSQDITNSQEKEKIIEARTSF